MRLANFHAKSHDDTTFLTVGVRQRSLKRNAGPSEIDELWHTGKALALESLKAFCISGS